MDHEYNISTNKKIRFFAMFEVTSMSKVWETTKLIHINGYEQDCNAKFKLICQQFKRVVNAYFCKLNSGKLYSRFVWKYKNTSSTNIDWLCKVFIFVDSSRVLDDCGLKSQNMMTPICNIHAYLPWHR